MAKIAVLSSNKNDFTDKLESVLNQETEFFTNLKGFNLNEYSLILVYDFWEEIDKSLLNSEKFINIHPSLLPSFDCENAIKEAFLAGVKVSGITIYKMGDKKKIIAQYPVLIGIDSHLDEIREEIEQTALYLIPYVADSILNNEVFDFKDLFGGKLRGCNSGGCGSCSGCKH